MSLRDAQHYAGCLVGGAVGDALGAPVEFLSLADIRRQHGPRGITGYAELNSAGLAEFTDDTQMTLFTAEGLILARERGAWAPVEAVYRAYLRWLRTQRARHSGPTGELTREGWLLGIHEIWKIRAPGGTCLSALSSGRKGTQDEPANDSKGCGGVMRVAPVGLMLRGEAAFEMGCTAAALTHGHPSGYLSAGVLAQVIAEILDGKDLPAAIQASLVSLESCPRHEETLHAVEKAIRAAAELPPTPESIETLGGGWTGEEALAIALFCALSYPGDFCSAVLLAVNHSGDSDSTGSITGNILGALLGIEAIPAEWRQKIELGGEIQRMAIEML